MSKNQQQNKNQQAKPSGFTVSTPEETEQVIAVLNERVEQSVKETPLYKAVQLCLNLFLYSSRYGGVKREHEAQIKEAITSLE